MTTGDALFAALLADPTDADARTIYAEWLEDNGQPETAAWWRGEEAATAMFWMKGMRAAIELNRKFNDSMTRFEYTPGEHSTFPVFTEFTSNTNPDDYG